MKKIIIAIVLASLTTACAGILDTAPKSQIADSKMWSTPSLSKAGVDGIMFLFKKQDEESINTLVSSDGKGGINRIGMEGTGYTSILDAGDQMSFLKNATKKASGTENSAEWRNLFSIVHACNKAIDHLDKDVVGEALYNQYVCEVRMLRAYAYSRLNMVFGEVPLYLHEIDNAECTKTQSSWDEVWQLVIDECTDCIGNADFQKNNFSGERLYKPSKGMAYFLRGNAYMWLAANMKPTINEEDPGISEAESKEFYTKAANDFEQVKACGFALWTGGEWGDLFQEPNEHNSEMIFPLEFSQTDTYTSVWQWVIGSRSQLNAWNRLVAASDFVDDFEWKDGSKFSWSQIFPDWSKLGDHERQVFFLRDSLKSFCDSVAAGTKYTKAITLKGQLEKVLSNMSKDGHDGQAIFDKYYLNIGNEARLRTAYDTRDPRLDQAVVTPYKKYRMFNEYISTPINFELRWPRSDRDDTLDDSDMWLEFASNMVYPWYKGLTTDGTLPTRGRDATDWPLIRYTEVQLKWAEALLQIGDTGRALQLLNEIRRRAGMPDVTATDFDTVMEEIRYETRVELCLEGKDFFNEIRWGTFRKMKFNGKKTISPRSCWLEEGWKTGYFYVEGMWPLSAPLDEIIKNPNLRKRPVCWTY